MAELYNGEDRTGRVAADVDWAELRSGRTAFALLHRPHASEPDRVEVIAGAAGPVWRLADLPLAPDQADRAGPAGHELVAAVPYRQLAERGFVCQDDGEPVLVVRAEQQASVPVSQLLASLPEAPIRLGDLAFDVDDAAYADVVARVLREEIGRGAGSNFVIKRDLTARLADEPLTAALAIFRRLLLGETGAYWTYLVHTGERTLVGASPERHVSVSGDAVTMNPISGTYRYPPSGPSLEGVLQFLADRKEADELYMVVDEELKMMAAACDEGGRMRGPYLREMAKLAHTEYLLDGRTSLDVREVLRRTLLAPTVTGSPLENACRVIARYEPAPRGYYSGVVALLGRDAAGRRTLDSAITIRSADLDTSGRLRIGVGATLVRASEPQQEVAETWSKAAGLMSVLDSRAESARGRSAAAPTPAAHASAAGLGDHELVRGALQRRNRTLSRYWLGESAPASADPRLRGRRALVVDAEDTFTGMLAHQLRSLGLDVTVRPHPQAAEALREPVDVLIVGPGPGNPENLADERIARLRWLVARRLGERRPLVSVCLGHQVLCAELGLTIARLEQPNQGLQRQIDLFGRAHRVGFYNTFVARCDRDRLDPPGVDGLVEIARDPDTDEVHALRGPGLASAQFHPESVLTEHGLDLAAELCRSALATATPLTTLTAR